jgi:RNA polymerase sigma factor (TIGR02999 family)
MEDITREVRLTTPSAHEITDLLAAWSNGDQTALEKLTPLVYRELHRLAEAYMRGERSGVTLQTTALVNEAYLRLIDARRMRWQNRAHFFAVSAQLMRHILVDFARARRNLKRGGDAQQVSLDEALTISTEHSADLVALDDALSALAKLDERQGRVVELRFFGGLTEEEIAEVLKVSPRTVSSDWSLARSWLLREMSKSSRQ